MQTVFSEFGAGYASTRLADRYVWTRGRHFTPGAKRGVLGLSGYTGTAVSAIAGAGNPALLAAGVAELNADLVDGKQLGNDTCIGLIDKLFAFGVSNCGFKSDKVILSSGSAGTLAAMNYAKVNPSKVAAIAMSLPLVNPQDVHDNSRGTPYGATPAAMEAVYGGSTASFNAAMPTHNPSLYPASYNGIPILMFASSDDPVCLFSLAQTFAAGCSTATLVNQGAIGHNGSTDPVLVAQANAFVLANA